MANKPQKSIKYPGLPDTYTFVQIGTEAGQAADAKVVGEIANAIAPTPTLVWNLKKNVDGGGNVSTNNYMAVTDAIPVNTGDAIIRKTINRVDNKAIIGYVSQFNGSTFIDRNTFNSYGDSFVVTNPNTTHVRVALGRASSSGVVITQNDVDTYFDINLYSRATPYITYRDNAFVNRGTVASLGYTSIGQCAEQGYYTFGSSDVLSDLPDGWEGGGLIITYKTGNTIWQRLVSLIRKYIRYGTTAAWRNEGEYVVAQYVAESGEDSSDARLNIYIPKDTKNVRTMYQMGHCVDAAKNANVWRLMYAFRISATDAVRQLTMSGEWECAIKIDGRDDFSGGIIHGDEIDTDVKVFADGTLINIANVNLCCRELKIVRHSNLYDPNDSTTIIAEHGVEYIYTIDGLTINQSIAWKVSASLANCFLAMLPIIKAYSKYRYDDTSFEVTENTQTSYSVSIPDAKSVTEYSTDYDCTFTVSVPVYPVGLTGGDRAIVTDNSGINYNKIYFPVCTGGTSQIGDLWKATTVYSNR